MQKQTTIPSTKKTSQLHCRSINQSTNGMWLLSCEESHKIEEGCPTTSFPMTTKPRTNLNSYFTNFTQLSANVQGSFLNDHTANVGAHFLCETHVYQHSIHCGAKMPSLALRIISQHVIFGQDFNAAVIGCGHRISGVWSWTCQCFGLLDCSARNPQRLGLPVRTAGCRSCCFNNIVHTRCGRWNSRVTFLRVLQMHDLSNRLRKRFAPQHLVVNAFRFLQRVFQINRSRHVIDVLKDGQRTEDVGLRVTVWNRSILRFCWRSKSFGTLRISAKPKLFNTRTDFSVSSIARHMNKWKFGPGLAVQIT